MPDAAPHRNTEKLLNAVWRKHGDKINVAIMCPPDIYGKGLGLANTSSVLLQKYIQQILKQPSQRAFYALEGTNTRSWVHLTDLMRVYLSLVEAAAAGDTGVDWNEEGYYFASTQEVSQIEIARKVGEVLKKQGAINDSGPLQISLEQVDGMEHNPQWPLIARYLFASNSRSRADRAAKLWGYAGKAPRLLDCLEEDVVAEIRKI
jgi:nucleoside-diphosphate-sugar epimerase